MFLASIHARAEPLVFAWFLMNVLFIPKPPVPAVPIAWHFMSQWLEGFSYRIALSPWFFVATCFFSLFVAVISVGIQILRAVTANPVESIKVE